MTVPSLTRRASASTLAASIAMVVLLAAPEDAHAQTTPMTPSEPHEALSFFLGSWTIEERPAEQQFVEACDWLPAGRRHMVCRSTWRVGSGNREGWSLFSYRAADSTYLFYGVRAGGAVEPMQGRRLADGWEFISEVGVGAARPRLRVTITRLEPQRFRLVAATAAGEGPWVVAATEHYASAGRRP